MQGKKLEALVAESFDNSRGIGGRFWSELPEPEKNRYRRFLEAALASPPVSDGGEFVMVPREPTAQMILAGRELKHEFEERLLDCLNTTAVYKAMIAASPSRPSPSPGQREVLALVERYREALRKVSNVSDYQSFVLTALLCQHEALVALESLRSYDDAAVRKAAVRASTTINDIYLAANMLATEGR